MVFAGAIFLILVAMSLLMRGWDVRLVLFAAGLAIASLKAVPWMVLDAFARTVGNGEIVGPICTSMGYAFVLRAMHCDQDMARLLMRPIQKVRWLLVPGGCFVGFLSNMAVTSQTAACASVGSIIIPLMRAAGYHPLIIAATLVLGCSGGGHLLSPGDPDIVAIQSNLKGARTEVTDILDAVFFPELSGFATAVIVFTLLSQFLPPLKLEEALPGKKSVPPDSTLPEPAVSYLKALLPPLPIVMLLLAQPRFGLFPWLLKLYPLGLPVPHAMVISTIIAMCITHRDLSAHTRSFFEGMGYAFVHVISLIIAANCFIEGLKVVELIDVLVKTISTSGAFARFASLTLPGLLAVVSGSGTAPSVAFSAAVLPEISPLNLGLAIDLGVLGAIGSTFGRTMSPVAAVVIFASTLLGVTPAHVVKRTAPCLLLGAVVVFLMMTLGQGN